MTPRQPDSVASRDGDGRAAWHRGARWEVCVVVLLGAMGWALQSTGPLATTLAVCALVLAPVAFVWTPRAQGLAAVAGVAAFAWGASSDPANPVQLLAAMGALAVGGVVSVLVAYGLRRRVIAERRQFRSVMDLERQRIIDRMRRGLGEFAARMGTANKEPWFIDGSPGDDVVALLLRYLERVARELEQAREQQKKDLTHAQEQSTHFIGLASHEFRTPLAVVQSAVEAIKLFGGRMSPTVHERLDTIDESIQHMIALLSNTLTFSQLAVGTLKYERQPVDLRTLTEEVVRDVQADRGERRIGLTVTCERLPQLDPSLMRQILTNLLTNAIKYSPEELPIDVAVVAASSEVRLRVADQGIGIPPADLEHVFDLFYRGDNVDDTPGTGIGLAITKRAVEMHGGTLAIESSVGRGTTVTVVLPERIGNASIDARPPGGASRRRNETPGRQPSADSHSHALARPTSMRSTRSAVG